MASFVWIADMSDNYTCFEATKNGSKFMCSYDALPRVARDMLKICPYNLCAACFYKAFYANLYYFRGDDAATAKIVLKSMERQPRAL